jgi:hypothetical protein
VWPQFTRQSRNWAGSHLSLVHVFHMIPLRAIRGWPIHYPGVHHYRNCGVSSDSATVSTTKFVELYKFHMRQYIIKHAHQGQATRFLIDIGRGYHLQSSEHEKTPLTALSIVKRKQHRTTIVKRGPIVSGSSHSTSTVILFH